MVSQDEGKLTSFRVFDKGFNSLMYFSATIFSSIGFSNPTAVSLVRRSPVRARIPTPKGSDYTDVCLLFATQIVSVTNFIFTLFALKYIDLVGRRRIMLWTVPGMCIGLVFGAACFHFLTLKTGNQLDPDRYPGFKYSQVCESLRAVLVSRFAGRTGS